MIQIDANTATATSRISLPIAFLLFAPPHRGRQRFLARRPGFFADERARVLPSDLPMVGQLSLRDHAPFTDRGRAAFRAQEKEQCFQWLARKTVEAAKPVQ
jgi:hypothetical protein